MTDNVREGIEEASEAVGLAWPLHSFVTANPLSGFENKPFDEAVREGERLFGGDGYPSRETLRAAWEDGRINDGILVEELLEAGYDLSPEETLERMQDGASVASPSDDRVDRVLAKWLSAFCDQGRAEAPMPHREKGFYEACRRLAKYDGDVPDGASLADLPDDPADAVAALVSDVPEEDRGELFEHHLSALPGWTAFVKQRAADGSEWQDEYHIDLVEYLAVRLAVADALGAELLPDGDREGAHDEDADFPLRAAWLNAWERTYREGLVSRIKEAHAKGIEADGGRPDAQMVFCIDTRSEVIRRAVEGTGDYETHGYAGFFGVPVRYDAYDDDVTVDACPPIVDAAHRVRDTPVDGDDDGANRRGAWKALKGAYVNLITNLETNVATAYSYVEMSGVGYGARMAARTLFPSLVHDAVESDVPSRNEVCEPQLDGVCDEHDHELPIGMTKEEMAGYAETAFSLIGWEKFARVVAFVGHTSETQNNPFDSALDCGACAGNPGGPNARILAAICNDEEVRGILADRGHEIPDDTVFVAGEHNTTTDEVTLFAGDVPESHEDDIESLRDDLAEARAVANSDRVGTMGEAKNPVREFERRAGDWAETRPEWGLAGNASFVIGPRGLTEDIDLQGRSFLHSYDWRADEDGEALEAIMQGPMVVTQWINCQYYFATVDNAVYGSGSKVTQNPVGNVGVYQGNGGDIMTGLPLQSLYATDEEPYHQPLRLTTVIHAPVGRVESVLDSNPSLATLLDNGWLSLAVVDPESDEVFMYEEGLNRTPESGKATNETPKPTVDN
ncbi:MAG: DUF2309 domain-containing protein [Halobacteriales archaeon]